MSELTLEQALQLGSGHLQAGRLPEAEALCRQVLAVAPRHPDGLHLLGLVALHTGHLDPAADLIRQAIAQMPGNADCHFNLGNVFQRQGRWPEAIASLRTATRLDPARADARALLAHALAQGGQHDEALAVSEDASRLQPDLVLAHMVRGGVLQRAGRYDEAEACLRQVLRLDPGAEDALTNLALIQVAANRYEEAIASYRQALRLNPRGARAHFDLAMTLLAVGQNREGWTEYEWRWQVPGFPSPHRPFPMPQWNGLSTPGGTVLVHAEQGLGDAIHFVRFLPLVRDRSGADRVVLECAAGLAPLFESSGNLRADVVARTDDQGTGLPPFQRHVPLASLPLTLAIFEPDDPAPLSPPYLQADPRAREIWRARVLEHAIPGRRRIGLVWMGSTAHRDDCWRSIPLAQFAGLADVPGMQFFSLQIPRAGQATDVPPPGMPLIDLSAHLCTFADTAALIGELDLVISVDTAVAHLAGALDKPVWTLVATVPDWRWGVTGDRTPWYPSMRLFRQHTRGDWATVLAEVAAALRASYGL